MTTTTGDLEALWELRSVLAETGPGLGLPRPLLDGLGEVFRAEVVSCNGMDSRARAHEFAQEVRNGAFVEADRPDPADPEEVAFWRCYWQSWCSHPERTRDTRSVRLRSDFLGRRAHHATEMYGEVTRAQGGEHEMLLVLRDGGRGRSTRLLLARSEGPDFSEHDRFLLELLRPHLVAALTRCEAARQGAALTPRQRDVLRLVLDGATNQAIGRRLGISEGTVRTHLQNAYTALGVSSRTEAAVRASHLS